MAARIPVAVKGCNRKQYPLVVKRGQLVLAGLYKRPDLYPNPDIAQAIFAEQVESAIKAQAGAKYGGRKERAERDSACGILFDSLDVMVMFTNLKQKGNAVNLLISGFPLKKDPTPRAVPEPPLILRIERGHLDNSAKILLVKGQGIKYSQIERLEYIVQMAYTAEEGMVYETVLTKTNQYKLLIEDLERAKEVYFRVAVRNSRGQSHWSFEVPFIVH